MTERQVTHYVGDACRGHEGDRVMAERMTPERRAEIERDLECPEYVGASADVPECRYCFANPLDGPDEHEEDCPWRISRDTLARAGGSADA